MLLFVAFISAFCGSEASVSNHISLDAANAIPLNQVTVDQIHPGSPRSWLSNGHSINSNIYSSGNTIAAKDLESGKEHLAAVVLIGEQVAAGSGIATMIADDYVGIRVVLEPTYLVKYHCYTQNNDYFSITTNPFTRFITGGSQSQIILGKDLDFGDGWEDGTKVLVVSAKGIFQKCSMSSFDWPIPVSETLVNIWMGSTVTHYDDQNAATTCDFFMKYSPVNGFIVGGADVYYLNSDKQPHEFERINDTATTILLEMAKMGGKLIQYVDISWVAQNCEDLDEHNFFVDSLRFLAAPDGANYTQKFAAAMINTSSLHTREMRAIVLEAMILGDMSDIFDIVRRRWLTEASVPEQTFMELGKILKSQFKTAMSKFADHDCAFQALVGASDAQEFIMKSFLRIKRITGDTCNNKICANSCGGNNPSASPTDMPTAGRDLEDQTSAGWGFYEIPYVTLKIVATMGVVFGVAFAIRGN